MATKKPTAKPATKPQKATPRPSKATGKGKSTAKPIKTVKSAGLPILPPVIIEPKKQKVNEKKSVSGANGGARPGAGRKKGSHNKKTQALIAAVQATGITPLDYMLGVMRDEERDLPTRMDAAKSAAPYVHAKLASVEHAGPNGGAITVQIVDFSALHKPKA